MTDGGYTKEEGWNLQQQAKQMTTFNVKLQEEMAKALCCPNGCIFPVDDYCLSDGLSSDRVEAVLKVIADRRAQIISKADLEQMRDDLRETFDSDFNNGMIRNAFEATATGRKVLATVRAMLAAAKEEADG